MSLIVGLVVCLTAAIAITLTAAGADAREAGCLEPVDPTPPSAGAPSHLGRLVPLGPGPSIGLDRPCAWEPTS